MNTPRHRKGNVWGYGVGLLALMITVMIGIYLYAESLGSLVTPSGNVLQQAEEQIKAINEIQGQREEDVERVAGIDSDRPKKQRFALVLLDPGADEARVVEAVQAITTMNAERARDLVKSVPMEIKGHMSSSEAESARKMFEALGAKVSVREEQDQDKS
ncbi:MAG TPA: ribosomal protein L7/L12 [Phycisphaerae bacterium]|nr:ribosomal protein L7/L12 [Phycisphaerae bacterium]